MMSLPSYWLPGTKFEFWSDGENWSSNSCAKEPSVPWLTLPPPGIPEVHAEVPAPAGWALAWGTEKVRPSTSAMTNFMVILASVESGGGRRLLALLLCPYLQDGWHYSRIFLTCSTNTCNLRRGDGKWSFQFCPSVRWLWDWRAKLRETLTV